MLPVICRRHANTLSVTRCLAMGTRLDDRQNCVNEEKANKTNKIIAAFVSRNELLYVLRRAGSDADTERCLVHLFRHEQQPAHCLHARRVCSDESSTCRQDELFARGVESVGAWCFAPWSKLLAILPPFVCTVPLFLFLTPFISHSTFPPLSHNAAHSFGSSLAWSCLCGGTVYRR